jgi:hypothetical protein
VFYLFDDQLQFNSETTAFDLNFDSTKGYEVPRAVTAIEWLDELNVLVSNDKEIKIFRVSKSNKAVASSAVEILEQTGELSLPKVGGERINCLAQKLIISNLHQFHINSLSRSPQNPDFVVSSDDLSCFMWRIENPQ